MNDNLLRHRLPAGAAVTITYRRGDQLTATVEEVSAGEMLVVSRHDGVRSWVNLAHVASVEWDASPDDEETAADEGTADAADADAPSPEQTADPWAAPGFFSAPQARQSHD